MGRYPARGGRARAKARTKRSYLTPLSVLARILIPIVLLAVIAVGVLYVRLLNGPISLKMLAQPIARAIAAELPGVTVTIDDAVVATTQTSLFEVQLVNVRFSAADGAPIAIAPQATVILSERALWMARIAPARVVLVEPRLLLTFSRDGGLSLSFSRGNDDRVPGSPPLPRNAAQSDAAEPAPVRSIDIGRTLAAFGRDAWASGNSASHLKHLGLRNATLIIDNAGTSTVSRITEAELYLDHRRQGSGLGGTIALAMPEGTWRADVAAESTTATGALRVKLSARDLVPAWLAPVSPRTTGLAGLRMPVTAKAELLLTPDGGLDEASAVVELTGAGQWRPPWTGGSDVPVDSGRLELRYTRHSGVLEMLPSELHSGASWMRLAGTARIPGEGQPQDVVFAVRSLGGVLSAVDYKVQPAPLDHLLLQGRYLPDTRTLELAEGRLASGGGSLTLSGRLALADDVPSIQLDGRLGAMPADALKRLWPAAFAADARHWVGNNITGGRLVAANLRIEEGGGTTARPLPSRSMATVEAADVRFLAVEGAPPVEAPRVLLRLEGPKLELSIPESSMPGAAGRRVQFRQARMTAPDVTSPLAMGDLTFRMQAPLPAVLDVLDQHARHHGRPPPPPLEAVDGRTEAQFKIGVPLGSGLAKWDVRVDGKGRITDGRAKNVIGQHDVQGATINVDLTDQLIDAKGDMLLAGVAAKLAWQRIFSAEPRDQPPLRLTARLDTADRTQLGIDINDLVQGETPVEMTVQHRTPGEPPQVQVRADLTNAELLIESLAWRKPPGRAAFLEFEIRQPQRGRTELANFKVVGDDIAVDGNLFLDQHNKAREFSFPSFSLNVVSRLAVQGVLKPDNVWDVKVTGSTYVGREFFRSLFSVGQIGAPLPPRKDRPGLDLKADVDTVVGFSDLALKNLRMTLSKRQGRIVSLNARGSIEGARGAKPAVLEATVPPTPAGGTRKMIATSDDAGQVFRLVDFYPNLQGGRMRLEVNLDGSGPAEKTGVLRVDDFALLGDPVVYEVLRAPGEASDGRTQRRVERPQLLFDRMTAPFSVGHGQFVINDADLRGQVIGVLLRGKADFRTQFVDLGGTYIPLQGVNSIIGAFPILGQLLAGTRGEGVVGMTFAIQGPMLQPKVVVNPLSGLLPGILRDMMQMTNPTPRITPRDDVPKRAPPAVRGKSSSQPPSSGGSDGTGAKPRVDADGGWSQGVDVAPPTRKR